VWTTLRHDNIILLFGWCMTAEHPFLVCPLMTGGDLAGYVRKHNDALGVGNRMVLLWDVAKGVSYLHGCKPPIIHRDLKALNCLVDASNGRVVVSDFGFAKAKEAGAESEGGGTVRWMAPELLDKSGQASEASDAYAFGMIVFEVFSGGLVPFEIITRTADVKQAVLAGTRPELPSTVPAALAESVKCLWLSDSKERPAMRTEAQLLEKLTKEHSDSYVRIDATKDVRESSSSRTASSSGLGLSTTTSGLESELERRARKMQEIQEEQERRARAQKDEEERLRRTAKDAKQLAELDKKEAAVQRKLAEQEAAAQAKLLKQFDKTLTSKSVNATLLQAVLPRDHLVVTKLPGAGSASAPGIFDSLAAALTAAAPEKTTIMILSGEYRESLTIKKSVNLVARGSVTLSASGEQPALTLENCTFRLAGLTIRTGDAASAVVLRNAQGRVEKCDVSSAAKDKGRCGVLVQGGSVDFDSCRVCQGGSDGIVVDGEARVSLEKCQVTDNADSGLVTSGTSRVHATACEVSRNKGYGVCARATSEVRLADCTLSGNGESGMRGCEESRIECTGTKLTTSGLYGAEATEGASIELNKCVCADNGNAGVCGLLKCSIKAADSQFFGNKQFGVLGCHYASLTLTKCEFKKNSNWAVVANGANVSVTCDALVMKGNGKDGIGSVHGARISPIGKKAAVVQPLASGYDTLRSKGEIARDKESYAVVVSAQGRPTQSEFKYAFFASTITEGLKLANSGSSIAVMPGEYRESVVVDKDVTLVNFDYAPAQGIGVDESSLKVKVVGSDAGPALTVKSKATVRGFHLENTSSKVTAVVLKGGNGWVLEGCVVKSASTGAYHGGLMIGGDGTLHQCVFKECTSNGVLIEEKSRVTMTKCVAVRNKNSGVYVTGQADVKMTDTECRENWDTGLDLNVSCNAVLERCTFKLNNKCGVLLNAKARVRMMDCECAENKSYGMRSSANSSVSAEHCRMIRNTSDGLNVDDDSYAKVVQCAFSDNAGSGIFTFVKGYCIAEQCSITNNDGFGAYRGNFPHSNLSLTNCTVSGNKKGDRKDC
jgi:pectin methylesterase-like acyl-CoA thioesterase